MRSLPCLMLLLLVFTPGCLYNSKVPGADADTAADADADIGWLSVSAGGWHSCGVRTSGSVECWGSDSYGQSSPPSGSFTTVSGGLSHSCGVTPSEGIINVECWGRDEYGQSSPPSGSFASVSAGALHNCGVTTSGGVECWGRDDFGQSSPPE